MGKLHLAIRELEEQFPTIADLVEWSKGENPDIWGMCQNNNGEIDFRKGGEEWLLQVTLNEIFKDAYFKYGEWYGQGDILIFYGVECFKTNDIYFELIELSSYIEATEWRPSVDWAPRQN